MRSFQVVLITTNALGFEQTCYFDNIQLVGPPQSPLEIPTLDRLGLAALALGLAVASLLVLRRSMT